MRMRGAIYRSHRVTCTFPGKLTKLFGLWMLQGDKIIFMESIFIINCTHSLMTLNIVIIALVNVLFIAIIIQII